MRIKRAPLGKGELGSSGKALLMFHVHVVMYVQLSHGRVYRCAVRGEILACSFFFGVPFFGTLQYCVESKSASVRVLVLVQLPRQ